MVRHISIRCGCNVAFCSAIKKRLERNAQDAPGSPPPELPNHVIILWPVGPTVNVTFVTSHSIGVPCAYAPSVTAKRARICTLLH